VNACWDIITKVIFNLERIHLVMKYGQVIDALQKYSPPEGWGGNLFLLPEPVMRDIYDHITGEKAHSCIELGTGFGATACVMAAALDEIGGGRLVTVDISLHQPVNVEVLMEHVGLDNSLVDVVVDNLGYNWYLPDLIKQQTKQGRCQPMFDFCLLDGAHEWEPDALAFHLVSRLLKIGAWIAVDDLNFNLRMIPTQREPYIHYTDRELDAYQMAMVFDIVVRPHLDFAEFCITHDDRIGWARKVSAKADASGKSRGLFSISKARLKFKELTRKTSDIARDEGLLAVPRRIWHYLLKDRSDK
jgi:predicted O-methyltransferase YrrM